MMLSEAKFVDETEVGRGVAEYALFEVCLPQANGIKKLADKSKRAIR